MLLIPLNILPFSTLSNSFGLDPGIMETVWIENLLVSSQINRSTSFFLDA